MPQRPWSGPRRFGWGPAPISWLGWAPAVACLASVLSILVACATSRGGSGS